MIQIEANAQRSISQVRLVSELDLGLKGDLFESCYKVVCTHLTLNGLPVIENIHQAFAACFLITITGLAVEFGDGGELWDDFADAPENTFRIPHLTSANSGKFGKAYRLSLKQLGLPQFEHVEGLLNLTPILLHAGIPASSASKVWQKIFNFVERGYDDGFGMISAMRQDPLEIRYFSKPAQRFITESGRYGVDLLQRMASVITARYGNMQMSDVDTISKRYRLPRSMISKLIQEKFKHLPEQERIPNPTLFIDLNDGVGPQFRLPALDKDAEGLTWRISDGEVRTLPASKYDERLIPVVPAKKWSVELMESAQRLKYREAGGFSGNEVWFFQDKGNVCELIDVQNSLEQELVFVLGLSSMKVTVETGKETELAKEAEYINFGGCWSPYRLFHLDLRAADSIEMTWNRGSEVITKRVIVVESPPRPFVVANNADFIHDMDGYPVFTSKPILLFSRMPEVLNVFDIHLTRNESEDCHRSLADLPLVGDHFSLEQVLDWSPGQYELRVLGPLGSDLIQRFTYLPGSRLDIPDRVFSPTENVMAYLHVDGAERFEVLFSVGQQRRSIRMMNFELPFFVSIPRVSFEINVNDSASKMLSTEEIFTERQFEEIGAGRIVVTCRKKLQICIVVADDEGGQISRRFLETKGLEGSASLAISVIQDDIRICNSEKLVIQLEFPLLEPIVVARVVKKFDGRIDLIEFVPQGGSGVGGIRVRTVGGLTVHDHKVVLKSKSQPWSQLIQVDVKNTQMGEVTEFFPDDGIPPGQYEIGISIDKPGVTISSTRRIVQLGSQDNMNEYAQGLTESISDAATRITLGMGRPNRLSASDFRTLADKVGSFIVLRHDSIGRDDKVYTDCVKLLLDDEHTSDFASWLCNILSTSADRNSAERFLIRIFPRLIDGPIDASEVELAERLWKTSPLTAAALVRPNSDEISGAQWRQHLGDEIESEPDVSSICGKSLEELGKIRLLAMGGLPVLGTRYAEQVIVELVHTIRKDATRLSGIKEINNRVVTLSRFVEINLPNRLETIRPLPLVRGRGDEELDIGMFVYNLYRLAWVVIDSTVPYQLAEDASELLARCSSYSRQLVSRCLIISIFLQRRN